MEPIDTLALAPAVDTERTQPSVKRVLQANRANLILFSFAPGQSLNDHSAVHPITVQCVQGCLDFTIGAETVRLTPGVVLHVDARVMHRVDCPADAPEQNILLLTMLVDK